MQAKKRKAKPILSIILAVLMILISGCEPSFAKVAYIEKNGEHPANVLQSTGVRMDVIDGELVLNISKTILSVDKEGNEYLIAELPSDALIETMYDGYVYYSLVNKQNGTYYDLYCCDMATGETVFLAGKSFSHYPPTILGNDSEIYFPCDNVRNEVLVVQGASCSELLRLEQKYVVGEKTYFVNSEDELEYEDASGNRILIRELSDATKLVPWGDGLLIYKNQPDIPLTYLSGDGTLTDLFVSESVYVDSSLNFHEDQAFFSIQRYRMGDKNKGLAHYENDEISGTYRIDLEDLSATKISDDFYRSIYIFNESSLFCVDINGSIVMTDFDGKVIQVVMEQ